MTSRWWALELVTPLPVVQAEDGAAFAPGRIYVAPPDRHLVLKSGRMPVTAGPRENRYRPSIDVLFRSAAVVFGRRVTGVVLTGMLDDDGHAYSIRSLDAAQLERVESALWATLRGLAARPWSADSPTTRPAAAPPYGDRCGRVCCLTRAAYRI